MKIILRWKNFSYMLETDISRNSSQKNWLSWRVVFEGLGDKWHPDALLAKTMAANLTLVWDFIVHSRQDGCEESITDSAPPGFLVLQFYRWSEILLYIPGKVVSVREKAKLTAHPLEFLCFNSIVDLRFYCIFPARSCKILTLIWDLIVHSRQDGVGARGSARRHHCRRDGRPSRLGKPGQIRGRVWFTERCVQISTPHYWELREGIRDLARTSPACLLDRQFPENLLFGQAKFSVTIFQFWLLEGDNQIFS